MRLNHNMYSLGIFKTYSKSLDKYSSSMNNVNTGCKISSAKDNPNKIAQVETLRMTVIGRKAASTNIQNTSSMLQTFDAALQEMNNNVCRMKQLTVQAATETADDIDRAIIQREIAEINNTLSDLAKNTDFNGVPLSSDSGKTIKTTIGTLSGEVIELPTFDVTPRALGLDSIDVTVNPDYAMDQVDAAVVMLTDIRSKYGSIQSRLDETNDTMSEINDVLTSAQSNLADADVAKEMIELTKNKILIDAGIGMMIQSNKLPQDALNILANVK